MTSENNKDYKVNKGKTVLTPHKDLAYVKLESFLGQLDLPVCVMNKFNSEHSEMKKIRKVISSKPLDFL